MMHCSPSRLRWNQPLLRQRLRGNFVSSLRLPNLSHMDLSVKRLIKKIVVCEIHRMIFAGGEGIYDPSSYCDYLTSNDLSLEVRHCILLFCKTGLRCLLHWRLACHVNVMYQFILIFTWPGLPRQEITSDPTWNLDAKTYDYYFVSILITSR